MTDKRIGVLMGGTSSEREVSLKSGNAIYNSLKKSGLNTVAIDVGHDICSVLAEEKIELAFLALHGGFGEDGSIQGMLDVLGIPYTGSGVLASALAMDKEASKKIFLYHNVPVPPFVVLKSGQIRSIEFDLPWVIKPAAEGSSVGVSIIKNENDLEKSLEKAFSFGSRAIVEKFIRGKEVHIGILEGKVLGGVEVRPSLEFYSYEAKYTAGLTEYILPPELDDAVYASANEAALSAHSALGCKGATRVDLRIDMEGDPFVLEVNTIPGMTETSLLPKIAGLAGLGFDDLINGIISGVINETK